MVTARITNAAKDVPATATQLLDAVKVDHRVPTIAVGEAVRISAPCFEPVEESRGNA
jgi:hypothetical protein